MNLETFFQWVPAETSAGLTRVMGESTNSVAYMQQRSYRGWRVS